MDKLLAQMKKTKQVKTKKVYKKKVGKKKPKKSAVITVGNVLGGFGDRYFCQLEVYDATFMAGAAALFVRYTLAATDLENAIAAQNDLPSGWAQLSNIYNKFIVHACAVDVEAVNLTAAIPINMSLFPSNFEEIAGDLNAYEEWGEYPYSRQALMTPLSGSKSKIRMKHFMTSKKVFGTSKLKSTNEDYVGFTGSPQATQVYTVPPNQWRFILGFNTLDGTTQLGTNAVAAKIRMRFNIEFFERLKGY